MVDGIKTVPTNEKKQEYKKVSGAWKALVPDPAASMERSLAEPLKLDREGVPLPPIKENWKKRKGSKDVRPEGFDYVMVRRCLTTGQFSKGSRNVLGKKKRRPA